MKRSIVTLSGLVLTLGLTSPGWAQLVGHTSASTATKATDQTQTGSRTSNLSAGSAGHLSGDGRTHMIGAEGGSTISSATHSTSTASSAAHLNSNSSAHLIWTAGAGSAAAKGQSNISAASQARSNPTPGSKVIGTTRETSAVAKGSSNISASPTAHLNPHTSATTSSTTGASIAAGTDKAQLNNQSQLRAGMNKDQANLNVETGTAAQAVTSAH